MRHIYGRNSHSGKQSEEPNKCKLPHHFIPVTRENKLYFRFRINNNEQMSGRLRFYNNWSYSTYIAAFYFPWWMGRSLTAECIGWLPLCIVWCASSPPQEQTENSFIMWTHLYVLKAMPYQASHHPQGVFWGRTVICNCAVCTAQLGINNDVPDSVIDHPCISSITLFIVCRYWEGICKKLWREPENCNILIWVLSVECALLPPKINK